MIRGMTVVAIVCLLCFFAMQCVGAGAYRVHELSLPANTYATAQGISDTGFIAGYYLTPTQSQPVIWDLAGNARLLSGDGEALDVNSGGQTVGWVNTISGKKAVVWEANGAATALPLPGGLVNSSARAISDTGWIVGSATQTATPVAAALEWTPNRVAQDFRMGPADTFIASDVNDSGVAVGYAMHSELCPGAVVYRGGSWSIIAGSTPYSAALAFGISDSGYIAGEIDGRPVIWNPGGSLVTLDGWGRSYAVNDAGFAVGVSSDAATLWSIAGDREALPMLTNGSTSEAYDINSSGWIVGECTDTQGKTHAVLWEPVPEPSAIFYALSCLGVAAPLVRKRRTVRSQMADRKS